MIRVAPAAPSPTRTLGVLVWAELTALRRSARTLIWTVVVPVFLLVLGELQVRNMHVRTIATFEISAFALTAGIFALGLFGYATVLAGYRDRGLFGRLRCTPAPAWQLLAARMAVQFVGIAVQAIVVLGVAEVVYGAVPGADAIALMVLTVVLSGFVALALGQAVVALSRSVAGTTAVARLLLIALFTLEGAFVPSSAWPQWLSRIADWTPIRLTQRLMGQALVLQHWGALDIQRLLAMALWVAVLGWVGLRWFRWDPE